MSRIKEKWQLTTSGERLFFSKWLWGKIVGRRHYFCCGWKSKCWLILENLWRKYLANFTWNPSFSDRKLYFSIRQCTCTPCAFNSKLFAQKQHYNNINTIENMWLLVNIKLQGRIGRMENKDDLFHDIPRIWTDITPYYVKSLYQTIPRRLLNVIHLKSHLTKY